MILMLNKFTLEKAIRIMERNPKGLLISRSELIGWMKSMNAYRKGDDEQTWLEFWDNGDQIIDLVKNDLSMYLRRTFLTVWGGVQDDLLHEMADGQKAESGHLGRFLFAYSDKMDKPMPSKTLPNRECQERFKKMCNHLHRYPHHISTDQVRSLMIPFNQKAKDIYYDYLCSSTKAQNEADNNLVRSILGKLETYTIRFACALKVMDMACEGVKILPKNFVLTNDRLTLPNLEIDEDIIIRALMLRDYFKATSNKVTSRIESPVNKLEDIYQEWYRALPRDTEFKTSVAIDSARKLKISQRSAERYLQDTNLFKKLRTGFYERRCL